MTNREVIVGKRNKRRARQASSAKVMNLIKSYIGNVAEHKAYNYSASGVTFSNTGTVSNISENIIQGDGVGQRSGNKVLITRLRVKVGGQCQGAGPDSCRYILAADMNALANYPVWTDLMDSTNIVSQYTVNYGTTGHRFKVLWDKTFTISPTGNYIYHHEFQIKRRHAVQYYASGVGASAAAPGALYMFTIDSNGTNPTVHSWTVQLYYTDI